MIPETSCPDSCRFSCLAAATEDSVCFNCWFAIGLLMQACISLILYTFHCSIRLKLNLLEKNFSFACLRSMSERMNASACAAI